MSGGDENNGEESGVLQAVVIGGGAGAAVGGPVGALLGAATGGIAGLLREQYGLDTSDLTPHDQAVLTSIQTLAEADAVREQTRIRFAHVADEIEELGIDAESGTGRKEIAPNVGGEPDILLSDIPRLPKLTVEVEDESGLQDPQHVVDQLNNYGTSGRKLILAVPDDDWDRLQAFLDDHRDEVDAKFHTARVTELDQHL